MCNNDNATAAAAAAAALVPYGLKSLTDPAFAAATAYVSLNPNLTQAALEHYRLQLYGYAAASSYADRFRYAHPALASHLALATSPYGPPGHPASAGHHHHHDAFAAALSPYAKFDPRTFRVQEEPKPQHSYIGLIGMAILSSPDKKLVLSDIYQYILDNYAYFRSRGPGWRNSIRHNLSLNDCFIKAGRSANGKGHYWAIHPANLEDFKKGDFRRRKAQRRVRKHMGLAVPEDEDSSSPPPPSVSPAAPRHSASTNGNADRFWSDLRKDKPDSTTSSAAAPSVAPHFTVSRRRQFDVESLLAPDRPLSKGAAKNHVTAAHPTYLAPVGIADHRSSSVDYAGKLRAPEKEDRPTAAAVVVAAEGPPLSKTAKASPGGSAVETAEEVEDVAIKEWDEEEEEEEVDDDDSYSSEDVGALAVSGADRGPAAAEASEEAPAKILVHYGEGHRPPPCDACAVLGLPAPGRPNARCSSSSSELCEWQETFAGDAALRSSSMVLAPTFVPSANSDGGRVAEELSGRPPYAVAAHSVNPSALQCEPRERFHHDPIRRLSLSSM